MKAQPSWPKTPPPLTPQQQAAREAFMALWLDHLPARYGFVERFNQGALARLPADRQRWRTLEIGAGVGAHLAFENLGAQEYYCLEVRADFCERLRRMNGVAGVVQADVERRTPFDDGWFDRVVAIHMLEHLRNLPAALTEIDRILAPEGIFDVVLPCEGGWAYSLGRRMSAKPMFERRFGMSYDPIVANEHVNTLDDVLTALDPLFVAKTVKRFPLGVPIDGLNLCIALRMKRRPTPTSSAAL